MNNANSNSKAEVFYKRGVLHFGGLPLPDLLKGSSTPVYIYHRGLIKRQLETLVSSLPQVPLSIHYAMKANSHPGILKFFQDQNRRPGGGEEGWSGTKTPGVEWRKDHLRLGVDVVSGGEITKALEAGFSGADLLFSGVAKTRSEIELALQHQCKLINVESPQELIRIGEMSRARSRKAVPLALRLNPDVNPVTHPHITTGFRENKFGMDFSVWPEIREILRGYSEELRLSGVTLHIGSQMMDLGALEEAIRKTIPFFQSLRSEGFDLRYFDVGGGLGIPYSQEDGTPSLMSYKKILEDWVVPLGCQEILLEPGRFLVGSAGILVCEVQYIKRSPYKNFIMVNTGLHHLLRPALYGARHRIWPVEVSPVEVSPEIENLDDPAPAERGEIYDVVGPICESSDVLGRGIRFPREIQQGDLLAILDAGAYGFAMASHYNSHSLPEEILVG